ncbi:iron chelate uptake ABC transporter family permease subunit [Thalassobacillus sp. C254]|uniref:iron chelate uptake ABC transporter family permease subunit n=1 Tax=Thalassobacillus sp. C254 TaxID=1225341 RepID=UPI0006D298BE|nr:iron chelate uptake ABC transporter family permease subunit [Thalassobacillus sp. C254]
MGFKGRLVILAILSAALIGAFVFINVGSNWDYVLPRRGMAVYAMILTGTAIAFSTLIFQTITNNRILTPSILGLDSLYMLIQTFIIFVFGSMSTLMSSNINFLLSVGLMLIFSALLYRLFFKKNQQNIYLLLLLGIIFGTLFSSLSGYMEMLIDPNEFQIVQDRSFASFNNVKTDLIYLSTILIVLCAVYVSRFAKYLNVLSLGREHAINLGVNYDYVVKRLLIVVVILISVATALVGPITFLGLLVVNVAYSFINTYRHGYLIIGSILISIVALVGGQLVVERVLGFSVPISVVINLVGGTYFIYLLLKESKKWSQ